MGRVMGTVLYGLLMVATIVGVDLFIFRHHFLARLLVNVGIVLIFGAFYLRFHASIGHH